MLVYLRCLVIPRCRAYGVPVLDRFLGSNTQGTPEPVEVKFLPKLPPPPLLLWFLPLSFLRALSYGWAKSRLGSEGS